MKIVILDASEIVRTKIEKLILSYDFRDVDIYSFEDGHEALDFIDDNDVDIIFSSIETKGLDGVSLVDLLMRKNPKLISKLFIVTSHTDSSILDDIKEVGAKRFIKKPIDDDYFRHFVFPEMKKIVDREN